MVILEMVRFLFIISLSRHQGARTTLSTNMSPRPSQIQLIEKGSSQLSNSVMVSLD